MNIGINGFEAVIPRFGFDKETGLPNRVGSSEFCFQLLDQFAKIDKKNKYTIYLPQDPTSDMPKESENWKYEIIPNTKLWTVFGLTRKLVTESKLDVFFSPTHYGPLYAHCPQVISVLDVSYKHFPEMFPKKDLAQLATWGKYSIKKAKKIITISNSSKSDIIKAYGISGGNIEVVHLGVREIMSSKMTKKEFIKKYNLGSDYILFVGTLQPRKNIIRLIEAFSQIEKKNINLVIVGKKGWGYEDILKAPKKFGVSDRVKFIDNVTDSDLPFFYRNAEVFVLPSLYEGFGLPVLEAMRYECPVIISNVSSLPEVGGEAAVYFDPESVTDIAEKVSKVLGDEKLRSTMIKKGNMQIKKFSWEKSARKVLGVLESVNKL